MKEFCDPKNNFKYLNHPNIIIEICKLEFYFYYFKNKNWENNVICLD